jgi:hypothetical protein
MSRDQVSFQMADYSIRFGTAIALVILVLVAK